ncbi:hypothetical protein EG328_009024 [Venturia inaequalis]|uniref:SET domain-containing protein n=1 Tax=Venturia inaequalis TaxID=5025 RepID=A0A8H3UBI7_VENIN|nr:hypothetical protein EG328_009024 [Venturia inaequalis]
MADTIDEADEVSVAVTEDLDKSTVQDQNENGLFMIVDIQGRGKGLVAIKKISAQTQVLAEKPLLKLDDEIDDDAEIALVTKAFRKLSARNQEAYLSLSGFASDIYQSQSAWRTMSDEHKKVIAVWGSNNWNDMVFKMGCRINHACAPNLETSWNERSGKQVWVAMRDIEEGEELTGTYVYDIERHGTAYRRDELKRYWGFECSCEACEGNQDVLEGKIEKRK